MGKLYAEVSGRLREFLLSQPVFFVATAPSGAQGHVNVSPKGLAGTFAVIDGATVAYLDYQGSGVETIAHLRDNGRIVLMFCAFTGAPTIVRLHGRGRAVRPDEPGFAELLGHFSEARVRGLRSVIVVKLDRISDSCGYGVPLLEYAGERDLLPRWLAGKTDDDIADYQAARNATSVDGLPALGSMP